jgi:purine-binding chemotaxis protein CheW
MKTHHTGVHSSSHSGHEQFTGLADQDAAIDAYLDGLLRDPESAPYWSTDATDVVDDYDAGLSDDAMGEFEQIKRPVGLSLVDLSKYKTVVIDEQVPEQQTSSLPEPEEPSSDALSLEMVAQESIELAEEDEAPVSASFAEPPEEVVSVAVPKLESGWQVFALGHLKVALPSTEIFDIIDGASLRPIPGAPANVAGAVRFQDRSRMILSLDAWLPKVTGDSRVVLLGAQGLWGVRVGAEIVDLTWDEAGTSWRDASERDAGRPWLAGVNRAAGVAFLAVESLRSALNASR